MDSLAVWHSLLELKAERISYHLFIGEGYSLLMLLLMGLKVLLDLRPGKVLALESVVRMQ